MSKSSGLIASAIFFLLLMSYFFGRSICVLVGPTAYATVSNTDSYQHHSRYGSDTVYEARYTFYVNGQNYEGGAPIPGLGRALGHRALDKVTS